MIVIRHLWDTIWSQLHAHFISTQTWLKVPRFQLRVCFVYKILKMNIESINSQKLLPNIVNVIWCINHCFRLDMPHIDQFTLKMILNDSIAKSNKSLLSLVYSNKNPIDWCLFYAQKLNYWPSAYFICRSFSYCTLHSTNEWNLIWDLFEYFWLVWFKRHFCGFGWIAHVPQ